MPLESFKHYGRHRFSERCLSHPSLTPFDRVLDGSSGTAWNWIVEDFADPPASRRQGAQISSQQLDVVALPRQMLNKKEKCESCALFWLSSLYMRTYKNHLFIDSHCLFGYSELLGNLLGWQPGTLTNPVPGQWI